MLDLGSFGPAAATPDAMRTMPASQAGEPAGETSSAALFGSFVDALADAADGGAHQQAEGDDRDDPFGLIVPVEVGSPIAPIPLPIAPSPASASASGSTTGLMTSIITERFLDLPLTAPKDSETGVPPEVELPAAIEETAVDLPLWPLADEADQDAPPIDQASLAKLKRAMAQADAAMTFRAAMRAGATTASGAQETSTTATAPALRQAAEVIARALANTTPSRDHAATTSGADRLAPSLLFTGARPASDAVAVDAAIATFMDHPNEDTATQIVQAIKLQWSRGVGEAHIRLEPQHFGGLTVSLKVEDGLVIARLQSDTAVIREWLLTNQAALRQSLSDQQLTLDRLEVTEPADETRHDERRERPADERQPERTPRRSRSDGTGEAFEILV